MTNRLPPSLDASLVEGTTSARILAGVEWLDTTFGAAEWNLRHVAVASAIVLGGVRVGAKKYKGIDWYALLHAIISGYGSLACVWLSVYSAETLTGTTEPLRSVLCQGPLTSLHRIIPAVTMGYGVFDIMEGFRNVGQGIDFLMHGLATFTIMAYFCEYNVAEIIIPMLLMEVSTVHLTMMRASFFSEGAVGANMGMFVLTFFVFRIFLCPYLWWDIATTTWEHHDNPTSQACLPWHFTYVAFLFGMFYNCLNAFWAYKIILKVIRKLNGKEKVKDSNELKDR